MGLRRVRKTIQIPTGRFRANNLTTHEIVEGRWLRIHDRLAEWIDKGQPFETFRLEDDGGVE